jgi:hypothetical protein
VTPGELHGKIYDIVLRKQQHCDSATCLHNQNHVVKQEEDADTTLTRDDQRISVGSQSFAVT